MTYGRVATITTQPFLQSKKFNIYHAKIFMTIELYLTELSESPIYDTENKWKKLEEERSKLEGSLRATNDISARFEPILKSALDENIIDQKEKRNILDRIKRCENSESLSALGIGQIFTKGTDSYRKFLEEGTRQEKLWGIIEKSIETIYAEDSEKLKDNAELIRIKHEMSFLKQIEKSIINKFNPINLFPREGSTVLEILKNITKNKAHSKTELLVLAEEKLDLNLIKVIQMRLNVCRQKENGFVVMNYQTYRNLMDHVRINEGLLTGITKLSFLHHSGVKALVNDFIDYTDKIGEDAKYFNDLTNIVIRGCSSAGSRLDGKEDRALYDLEKKARSVDNEKARLTGKFFDSKQPMSQEEIKIVKDANIRARTKIVERFSSGTIAHKVQENLKKNGCSKISIKAYVGGYEVTPESPRPFSVADGAKDVRDAAQPKALICG